MTLSGRDRSRIGVCSWSLRPQSASELASLVHETGAPAVQLALDPLRSGAWDELETQRTLDRAGIAVLSGMMGTIGEDYSTLETIRETGGIRSDVHWPQNLANARAVAAIAQRMGLGLVTFHAGFLPHDSGDGGCSPLRATMLSRLRLLGDAFGDRGIRLGLETGQESADTLLVALRDLAHPNIGVNFDPANMILYGMGDPITALRELASHVWQVHIKDARPTRVPGTWGEEVPVGTGAVDWSAFIQAVRLLPRRVDLVIEREAGEARVQDIRTAANLLRRLGCTESPS